MSKETIGILLVALAGFLIGGVYSTWKTAKLMAAVLGVAALLAIGGAVAWFVG
ncbi:MAG TPA: hypothetical protein VJT49_28750 [Amycolatopsis sp.]|uniref:hypothetical protein n=1 Tax=Amycolatopsis sp. TaxID=37632 RepID=UPI002B487D94|nr:hypothetical protein [Amycolatopsis sp.]HKS49028.1 hypothetical protein [Amycolatopsis sp.]